VEFPEDEGFMPVVRGRNGEVVRVCDIFAELRFCTDEERLCGELPQLAPEAIDSALEFVDAVLTFNVHMIDWREEQDQYILSSDQGLRETLLMYACTADRDELQS